MLGAPVADEAPEPADAPALEERLVLHAASASTVRSARAGMRRLRVIVPPSYPGSPEGGSNGSGSRGEAHDGDQAIGHLLVPGEGDRPERPGVTVVRPPSSISLVRMPGQVDDAGDGLRVAAAESRSRPASHWPPPTAVGADGAVDRYCRRWRTDGTAVESSSCRQRCRVAASTAASRNATSPPAPDAADRFAREPSTTVACGIVICDADRQVGDSRRSRASIAAPRSPADCPRVVARPTVSARPAVVPDCLVPDVSGPRRWGRSVYRPQVRRY